MKPHKVFVQFCLRHAASRAGHAWAIAVAGVLFVGLAWKAVPDPPSPTGPQVGHRSIAATLSPSRPGGVSAWLSPERRSHGVQAIPSGLSLPVLDPVKVDYRNDGISLRGSAPYAQQSQAPGPKGTSAPQTGASCNLDIECSDCNPCTLDTCTAAVCAGGARNGFACKEDRDCDGVCIGGVNDGLLCRDHLECCGDGVTIADGICSFNPCTFIESPARNQCVNTPIPDGQFELGSECDDGLECNGQETCNSTTQTCVPGTPLCDPNTKVCDEATNSCIDPCLQDSDCEIDGLACTADRCDAKRCVGGGNAGLACRFDADCPGGGCTGGGTGGCILGPNPCGPGGICTEITVCTGDGMPCDTVSLNPCPAPGQGTCTGAGTSCGIGRCCDDPAFPGCTAKDFPSCSGSWLATDLPCGLLSSGIENGCPIYGGGIAPQGTFVVSVGPVTPFAPCPPTLDSVGDDYRIGDGTGFVAMTLLRFAATVDSSARFAIAFHDANGIFIKRLFVPAGANAGVSGPSIFTLEIDPPLVVPAGGFVVMSIGKNFSPFGSTGWLSTDGVDVGANDAGRMWVNGAATTGNFLGRCEGGSRDGLWCDVNGLTASCPGGTCMDVPDVLAFEMVATMPANAPLGACCSSATGECTREFPWICASNGGAFLGTGTFCKMCYGNPFVPCGNDSDCPPVCIGGINDAEFCSGGADCPGGVCGVFCVPIPPACSVQACCDSTSGACTQVSGTCQQNPAAICTRDVDCGGLGPCVNLSCPVGTVSGGSGSSCDLNCCQQPVLSGGDNCLDVPVTQITVPPVSLPAVTTSVTLTGNNSTATFDDFNTAICVGGTSDGMSCDPSAAADPCPAGGGVCTQLCGSNEFDPGGRTKDPGWWEAFHIDACADVRIDLCCTQSTEGQPLRPFWQGLHTGCPCKTVLAPNALEPPIGACGLSSPFSFGSGVCDDDNACLTYGPLPPGTYYYPIYSAQNGTFAAPPGGTYQFHVTARACREAACCSTVCNGGGRDSRPCNLNGHPTCPDGECIGGVCVGGVLQGFACDQNGVDECPGGTCDSMHGCNVVNQLVCDAAGGRWLAGNEFPDRICDINSADPGAECTVNAQCSGGLCVDNPEIDDCTTAPCQFGACCLGPGNCVDDDGVGGSMTPALCGPAGLNGTFVGGARCLFSSSPCPICTVPQNTDHCQRGNSGFIISMDRVNGRGRKVADDFIAHSTEIGEFCWSPFFVNVKNGVVVSECSDPNGASPPPPDNFEIRFYKDNNGRPGELLHELAPVEITAKVWRGGNSRGWDYSTVFDPPLGSPQRGPAFVLGQRYWVELSGAGIPGDAGVGCDVFIHLSEDGNGIFYQELDHFKAGGQKWSFEDNSGNNLDVAFCLGGPATPSIEVPPPLTGACCECDGTCHDDVDWRFCRGNTCLADDCEIECDPSDRVAPCTIPPKFPNARFFPGQSCAQAGCVAAGSGAGCPGTPTPVGENCTDPVVIDLAPQFVPLDVPFSTICSTTDGELTFPGGCNASPAFKSFDNDIWFEFTSTTTGVIEVDLCGDTDFDNLLAIYSNGTGVCPNVDPATGAPTVCPPPQEDLVFGVCQPSLCNASLGKPSVELVTDNGVCHLLRIGGSMGDAGVGLLTLRIGEVFCFQSSPAVQQMAGSPAVADVKNRYLSIKAGDAGRNQAIRVTLMDAPPSHASLIGAVRWVGETVPLSFAPSRGFACTNTPGCLGSDPFYMTAKLQCDPLFRDWTTAAAGSIDGFIHVGGLDGEFIFPGATYQVDVIDDACLQQLARDFSIPITVKTSGVFGDVCRSGALGPCQDPPDPFGSFGGPDLDVINDVVGENKAFAGLVLNKIQADLEGQEFVGAATTLLDGVIQITEVRKVNARIPLGSSAPYEFGPEVIPTCP